MRPVGFVPGSDQASDASPQATLPGRIGSACRVPRIQSLSAGTTTGSSFFRVIAQHVASWREQFIDSKRDVKFLVVTRATPAWLGIWELGKKSYYWIPRPGLAP